MSLMGLMILAMILFCIYWDEHGTISHKTFTIVMYIMGFFTVVLLIMTAVVVKISCFEQEVRMQVESRESLRDNMNMATTIM